nr:unnamed protein product [Spirometra erinaceieuropaei]
MLGIRTALKPDLECSAAELVYGTTLRIPGDFFGYYQSSADLDPSDYVQRLHQTMTHLRATPPRPSTNSVRRPLQQPYDGPFRVLSRKDKRFTIDRGGRSDVVSIDRLKAAYTEPLPTSAIEQPTLGTLPLAISQTPLTPNNPASSLIPQTPPLTRSGRHDLAIGTIALLLQSKFDETENRPGHAQDFHLLKSCTRTHFTFDGIIYEQVKGTPMGSPILGFIAEAVLQRLESLVFQHHKPKFWARYVDDTLVVIDRNQLLTFKERLDAVFPYIQFTMKVQENNQLAFLDVLVCRKDCGGLKTKVFRKATNTMQVLNVNSNHTISHKRSCVRTLYRRVEAYCNEPEDKIAEIQYLRRVFKTNGYPRHFVNRCIRKRDERPNRTETKSWRALPYVKNVSEALGRLLASLGVVVAHRPEATIRCLVIKPKKLTATARNVWSRLSDLVQLWTKQLRRRNRKTTLNANSRTRGSGAVKRR